MINNLTILKFMDIKNTSNYLIRTSNINAYINDIKHINTLTPEEEYKLFEELEKSNDRIKAANNERSVLIAETMLQDKIKQDIVSRNQRFNFGIAKRYSNNDTVMDLVSVGTEGMYKAIEQFNYKLGHRFCTFAKYYIQREITAFLSKENIMVRTTNDMKIIAKVKKIENTFFAREGRMPSTSEIKDILKSKYDIENIDSADFHMVHVDSIDVTVDKDDDNYTGGTFDAYSVQTASFNDYDSNVNSNHLTSKVKELLATLPERERIIISMSVGFGYDKEYKDAEIAEVLDMSSERVRQLRKETIKKLASNVNIKTFFA